MAARSPMIAACTEVLAGTADIHGKDREVIS
jgi:hypothetical protein